MATHMQQSGSRPSGILRIPSALLVGIFGLTLTGLAWFATNQLQSTDRDAEIARAHRDNDAMARAYEEHVRRVIQSADGILLFLEHEFEEAGKVSPELVGLVERAKRDPVLNQVAVVDADGDLVLSAVPHAAAINVSGGEGFLVHAASASAGLHVGKPIRTQVAGTWTIFLSRRLDRPDGGFAGLVSVGLDPGYFAKYYEELELDQDRAVLVVGLDGIVRARRFQGESEIGQDFSASPMFARLPREPVGHYEVVGLIDQRQRFVSYRALPDLPLVVAVSELTSGVLGPFERRRAIYRRSAMVFTAFVAVFCATLVAAGRRELRQSAQLSAELAERNRAERALREANERYRDLFENANDAIFLLDERHRYVDANRRAVELFGFTREEFVGREVRDFIPPDQVSHSEAAFRELVQRGEYEMFEGRMRRKDGRWLDIEVSSSAIMRDGAFAGSRDIVRDITDRKRAEGKLREGERFIRSILDTVDEGFIVVDRDYRILTANRAYCDQAALAWEEVIGRRCHEVSHKSSSPCFEAGEECAVKTVFETGKARSAIHRHPRRDGSLLFVETKAFPIKDDEGNIVSVIETLNNITERHLLEEERLKTQKLESIGTLAGGIAHDFNNLLQGVFGFISMAKLCLDHKERSLAMIEQAEKALHQAVSLTTQLLTFSKGGKPVREPIALEPVLENAVRFALSGSSVEYRLELEPGLWRVDADEGQLGQVFQNIAINAGQAMPRGGCVEITACNVPASGPDLPPGLTGRNAVRISIRDNGVGIPAQDLQKIFDPYYTTKEKGSGLGLATSYSIVRSHEGQIVARSAPGGGSTFTVWLPASDSRPRTPQTASPAAGSRKARILVMDDEDIIRNVAGELLAVLGHEAVLADKGEAAHAAYQAAREEGRPFGAVILDLTIRGGMGGVETVQRLRAIDPGVKAVASSGYSDDAASSGYRAEGFVAFLKKPYTVKMLQDTLDSVLS